MNGLEFTSCALDADLPENAALDAVLTGVTLALPPEASLLVVTEDAGRQTAERFYADALATGVALASPAAFPWCLANAPCGVLSRRYGLSGPNVTWLVDNLGSASTYDPLADWFTGAPVLVAAIRFENPGCLCLWHGSPNTADHTAQFASDWSAAQAR